MPDVVSPAVRSRMMAGIKGKNTKPELIIRSGLHRRGFRFSLHGRGLPGRPDLVLPKHDAVIFVHGCFWHGHGCHLFKWPSSREEFWKAKISKNRARDCRVVNALQNDGWRTAIVWECALKGTKRMAPEILLSQVEAWLNGRNLAAEFSGHGDVAEATKV